MPVRLALARARPEIVRVDDERSLEVSSAPLTMVTLYSFRRQIG